MLRIEDVRACCADDTIVLTEQYSTDYPFPSCLINAENIHIVCSVGDEYLYIITAYRPSPEHWEAGNRKRKEKKP